MDETRHTKHIIHPKLRNTALAASDGKDGIHHTVDENPRKPADPSEVIDDK
jgi:hypothetical protein